MSDKKEHVIYKGLLVEDQPGERPETYVPVDCSRVEFTKSAFMLL